MSNFLKKFLSSKSSSKELSRKEIDGQHTTSSNTNDITNDQLWMAKIENDFLS